VISDADPAGPYASLSEIKIPPIRMGEASLTGTGLGVVFDGGWNSIGVESGGMVTGTIDGALGAVNTLIAKVKNTGAAGAEGVRASFRLANFGIGSPDYNDWVLIDTHPATPPVAGRRTRRTGRRSRPVVQAFKANWKINAADIAAYTGHGNDQCPGPSSTDKNAVLRRAAIAGT
jgi:hypothetical protein